MTWLVPEYFHASYGLIKDNFSSGLHTTAMASVITGLFVHYAELGHQNIFYNSWSVLKPGPKKLCSSQLELSMVQLQRNSFS